MVNQGVLVRYSLHAQGVLSDRLAAVLVAAGLLLEEEALGEPERAVLPLAARDEHAQYQDDEQEEGRHSHQHQLAQLEHGRGPRHGLTWGTRIYYI